MKKTEKKSRRRAVETVEFAVPAAVGREERRGPIRARRGEIQAAVGGVDNSRSCPRRPRARQYPPPWVLREAASLPILGLSEAFPPGAASLENDPMRSASGHSIEYRASTPGKWELGELYYGGMTQSSLVSVYELSDSTRRESLIWPRR